MERGSYAKKINFEAFKVTKFTPHIYGKGIYQMCGCGASTLALITGENPLVIAKKRDWTSRFMCSYLRQRNFKVAKLTERNVTNFKEVSYPIRRNHVILATIKYIKGEASWVIIYNDMLYHNFEIIPFESYELINHPLMTAFLLYHKDWVNHKHIKYLFRPNKK